MKNIIYIFGIIYNIIFVSCSLDNQFDSSNEFKVMLIETADTLKWPVPGDTVNMQVFASIASGSLEKIEIINKNFETNDPISQFNFSCIDGNIPLSVDEEGYFSRPVSTVLAYYPVIIPEERESLGKFMQMTFRVTAEDGRSDAITTSFEVSNFKVEQKSLNLPNCRFYSSANHEVYADSNYREHVNDIDLVSYLDEDGIYYYISPSSEKASEILKDSIPDYQRQDMITTKFVLIDKEFDDIQQEDLDALDFSQGEEYIKVENKAVIGYVNSEGRRCIVNASVSDKSQSLKSIHDFYIIKQE